jgi:hypothetical protein
MLNAAAEWILVGIEDHNERDRPPERDEIRRADNIPQSRQQRFTSEVMIVIELAPHDSRSWKAQCLQCASDAAKAYFVRNREFARNDFRLWEYPLTSADNSDLALYKVFRESGGPNHSQYLRTDRAFPEFPSSSCVLRHDAVLAPLSSHQAQQRY